MSEVARVAYVVEGLTDYYVLNAIFGTLSEGDYVPTCIQPPESAYADDQGPLGGGWRGVRKWCDQQGRSAVGFLNDTVLANFDYLIIHIDADIATEPDLSHLDLSGPSAPRATCCGIREHLASLLGANPVPHQVVLCVPAQCTEAWVFVALYPGEVPRYRPIEGRVEVEALLIGKPERLVRRKDGAAKKQTRQYQAVLGRISGNWDAVVNECHEARRFDTDLRQALT